MTQAPPSQPGEETLRGHAAAPGCVAGAIHRLAPRPWQEAPRAPVAPAAALARFDRALAGLGQGDAAPPLQDADFLAGVRSAIAGGESPLAAFGDGLDHWCADRALPAADFAPLRRALAAALGEADTAPLALPAGAIVVARDLTPTRFLEIDWRRARGLALAEGDARGHVALLARARGLPLVLGLGADLERARDGVPAILDGGTSSLILRPEPATAAAYRRPIVDWAERQRKALEPAAGPARTADGTVVQVTINVESLQSLEALPPAACDGIGLVRSELLLPPALLRDEGGQVRLYRALLFWAEGRPVTVRTLDAGGDKPVPGLSDRADAGGARGLALSLAQPEIFGVQLRALARAAAHGPLRVLLPAVTAPAQVDEARRLLQEALASLRAEGQAAALPPLGIMVETEAALERLADFEADFFAIGSNDLERIFQKEDEQNMTNNKGIDGDPHVKQKNMAVEPRVMTAIKAVCRAGRTRDIPVSLCGELASRPEAIPALLKAGLRSLSVPPSAVGAVKRAVAACRL